MKLIRCLAVGLGKRKDYFDPWFKRQRWFRCPGSRRRFPRHFNVQTWNARHNSRERPVPDTRRNRVETFSGRFTTTFGDGARGGFDHDPIPLNPFKINRLRTKKYFIAPKALFLSTFPSAESQRDCQKRRGQKRRFRLHRGNRRCYIPTYLFWGWSARS